MTEQRPPQLAASFILRRRLARFSIPPARRRHHRFATRSLRTSETIEHASDHASLCRAWALFSGVRPATDQAPTHQCHPRPLRRCDPLRVLARRFLHRAAFLDCRAQAACAWIDVPKLENMPTGAYNVMCRTTAGMRPREWPFSEASGPYRTICLDFQA